MRQARRKTSVYNNGSIFTNLYAINKNNLRLPSIVFKNLYPSNSLAKPTTQKSKLLFFPIFIKEIHNKSVATTKTLNYSRPVINKNYMRCKSKLQNDMTNSYKSRALLHFAHRSNSQSKKTLYRDYNDFEDDDEQSYEQSYILNEWKRVISCNHL